jgi:hypothetical protein
MVASVQFMITNQNKKKLSDLGYPAEEIEIMEPTLAMSVISRNMIRPWGSKPMPEVRSKSLDQSTQLGQNVAFAAHALCFQKRDHYWRSLTLVSQWKERVRR